ncbi:hypothetical protein [Fusobacterium perfoetens]|uniref:hypothetical protein n=1 Tax=Fusobacterium perfoetens TaxID=852 RepID=UPI001F4212F5|nr:hypothetical protein [Fusobacterium perfoetens]MCF2611641.1 hypothetical protein [Fusobacterium perfoetens]
MAVQQKEYPLGECEIKFTPKEGTEVKILRTLKEEECSLVVTTDGYKVEVDQLEGPYLYNTKLGEATFKCSTILDIAELTKMTNLMEEGTSGVAFSTSGKPMQVGKLEIHPLSKGESKDFDITAPKAFLKPEINIAYKKEGLAKCGLTFEFAADENPESPTYKKIFTVGNYTK